MTDTPISETPTAAANWKGRRSGQAHSVTVPSGNVALCNRPGLDSFLRLGLIPNSLMGIVQRSIQEAQKGKEVTAKKMQDEMNKLMEDPTKLADVLDFADKVVCFICVSPKVLMPPPEGEARDENVLYADEVDMDDKMFLFQWAVGGTESVDTFREESGANVGASQHS